MKLFILILFRFCFYFFSRVLECNVTRSASRKEQLATLPYFRNTPIRLCFFLFFLFFLFYHQLTHYLILCLDVLTLFTVIISLFYTSLFIFFFLSLSHKRDRETEYSRPKGELPVSSFPESVWNIISQVPPFPS